MKKKKLQLKKITISNLSEDIAKSIYGGVGPAQDTYNCTMATACAQTCDPVGCNTYGEHTYGCPTYACTNLHDTCQATYYGQGC